MQLSSVTEEQALEYGQEKDAWICQPALKNHV